MNISIKDVEFESAEIVKLVSTNDFTEKEKMEMLGCLFPSSEIVELVSTNDFTEKEKMEMLCWLFPMFNNRKQTNKGKLMVDIIQFINDNRI